MAWIIAIVILLLVVFGYLAVNRVAAKRIADRHGGDSERALSDESEPIPSAHLITDDERPLGDTPEAHDEVSPRDIPLDNPGRHEAAERG